LYSFQKKGPSHCGTALCKPLSLLRLLGLEVLGACGEYAVRGPEENYAYYVDQDVHGQAGDDLPSKEYADAAADHVAQGSHYVVAGLLDEHDGVSGHEQSAGAHEYGEADGSGAAQQQAGSHAGCVEAEANVHQSAPEEVQDNRYPELPLAYGEANALADGAEGAYAGVLAGHYDGGADHGAAEPDTDLVNVPFGDYLSHGVGADHGGYAHRYEEDGLALNGVGEDQSLEDNGEGIADVKGAGDVDVVNILERLVHEGGRSKGTAAQGIQEVSQNTYEQTLRPELAAGLFTFALMILVNVNEQVNRYTYEASGQDNLKCQYH